MTITAPRVFVALKWAELRSVVDPLTGVVEPDPHGGLSPADRAALELALRVADGAGMSVAAVTVGTGRSDPALRLALEAGCADAVRIDGSDDLPSVVVAAALATEVAVGEWVFCGDASLDRGSGSVPAFLAGHLAWAQALGVARVVEDGDTTAGRGGLVVERRLEGGRREVLSLASPAVVSVESGAARLRRPLLASAIDARRATLRIVSGPTAEEGGAGRSQPFRPRPRVLEGPDPSWSALHRQVALSGALSQRQPPRLVHAEPEVAVQELFDYLESIGRPIP